MDRCSGCVQRSRALGSLPAGSCAASALALRDDRASVDPALVHCRQVVSLCCEAIWQGTVPLKVL